MIIEEELTEDESMEDEDESRLPVYHNRLHRCIKVRVLQDRLDKDEEQIFFKWRRSTMEGFSAKIAQIESTMSLYGRDIVIAFAGFVLGLILIKWINQRTIPFSSPV